jgi:DNA-binding NarL/FixJ family response regulator
VPKTRIHEFAKELNMENKDLLKLLEKMGYRADVVTNGLEVLKALDTTSYTLVLMDIQMPEMDGITCIREIKAQRPEANILVLTNFAGEDMIFPAIKAGAMGYHLKDSSPEALEEAIRQVFRGEPSLHPLIAKKVLEELVQRKLVLQKANELGMGSGISGWSSLPSPSLPTPP